MASDFNWYGPQVTARIRAELRRRLARAAILVANHAKQLVSADGTAKGAGGRDSKGRYRKGRLQYNANPSAAGEPPRVQTGRLRGSIAWEVDDAGPAARVGSNLKVARWLELGTRLCRPRPWLSRALREKQAEVRTILSEPMKGP